VKEGWDGLSIFLYDMLNKYTVTVTVTVAKITIRGRDRVTVCNGCNNVAQQKHRDEQ
jgi:hypothetical protein